jgi:hypothetical protein
MKIKWQERKILWKRQPLYRIMCCYLLNMCYEKKKKDEKIEKKTKKLQLLLCLNTPTSFNR